MGENVNLEDYSFDLGKLEESSNLLITNRKREVEQIDSEDDGPEDFTLNMGKWMRGTGPYQKGNAPTKDVAKVNHEAGDESGFLPLNTSTPTPVRSRKATVEDAAPTPVRSREAIVEDTAEVESPTRLPTPKLPRLNTETEQERATEEVFDRISALQAEVERLRVENEERFTANKHLEEENAQMQADNQKLYTRLQDTNSVMQDLRTENEERFAANKGLQEEKAQMQADNQKLYTRLQDTNGMIRDLQTKGEERLVANRDLQEENAQMQADNQKLYTRLQDAIGASERLEEENAKLRTNNQRLEHDSESDNEDLRRELQVALSSNECLRKDVATLKQATTDHEAAHKADIEALKASHEGNIATMRLEYAKEIGRNASDAISGATKAMQKREATLEASHQDSLSRIIAMQKDITMIKSTETRDLRSRAVALSKELRSTKAALANSQQESQSLRQQLQDQHSALATSQRESRSLQQQLTDQQSSHEAANVALEEQYAAATEARETEWRRRIGVLLKEREKMVSERKTMVKEREKMGKIVMQGWGREEVGVKCQGEKEKGQGYRYKYVERR